MSGSWVMKWLAFTRHLVPKLPLPSKRENWIALLDAGIVARTVGDMAGAGTGSAGSDSEGHVTHVCVGCGGEGCRSSSIAWRSSEAIRPNFIDHSA